MNGCCCGMTRSSIRTYASMWNYIGWFLLGTYFVIFPFERLTYDCSCVVDDLVSQCVRKAKQCGLVMVQTPVSAFVLLQQFLLTSFIYPNWMHLSQFHSPFLSLLRKQIPFYNNIYFLKYGAINTLPKSHYFLVQFRTRPINE